MKKLALVVAAVGLAVALSGCCGWRGRTCPVKPCLVNPCAPSGVCNPCGPGPAPMKKAPKMHKAEKSIEK